MLFSYTLHIRYGTEWSPVKLEGLEPSKMYTVKEINLYPGAKSKLAEDGKAFTGEYLMDIGLNVSRPQELTSSILEITQKEP